MDADALLCDMAETYGVYDLRALPLQTTAILARGLRPTARIMQRLIEEHGARSDVSGFESPEAFLAARDRLLEEHQNGN